MAEQASKVSGIVQIDGTPAQRTVRAFGYEAQTHAVDGNEVTLSRTLGHATSDPATGEYTIDLLAGYADPIFVVAFDDYGADFTPDMALTVGDRVHPTTPNGHVWECTSAGTLPSEEPTWVVDTETAQLYGTASMIAKPFYRPMVHGPVSPEVTGVFEPIWTPANLFSNNEQGAWYDPSDLTTLFQDEAGTIPVEADGDPVALIRDKSGNGIDASQASSHARPIYRTDGQKSWLDFYGEQYLSTAVLDLSAISSLYTATGIQKTQNVFQQVVGFGSTGGSTKKNGSWDITVGLGSGSNREDYGARMADSGQYEYAATESPEIYPAPDEKVVAGIYDRNATGAARIELRLNAESANGTHDPGQDALDPVFGAHPINIGHREGGAIFTGRIYNLVIVASTVELASQLQTEEYLADKAGIILS